MSGSNSVQGVKRLNLNDTTQKVFVALSKSESDSVNCEKLAESLGVPVNEVMFVFHGLQSLGAGSLVVGRDNIPTQFVSKYSLKNIGADGLKEDSAVDNGVHYEKETPKASTPTVAPTPAPIPATAEPEKAAAKRNISDEVRNARRERMKAMWASGKMREAISHRKDKSNVDRSKLMKDIWKKRKEAKGVSPAPVATITSNAVLPAMQTPQGSVDAVNRIIQKYTAFATEMAAEFFPKAS